jgi:glucosaminylphosphatidylinositol acyltransferase
MIVYEFAIVGMGLKDYVFYGPRNDFISANREGVVSSFGYLAVCLIGIEFGRNIFRSLYDQSPNQLDKEKS